MWFWDLLGNILGYGLPVVLTLLLVGFINKPDESEKRLKQIEKDMEYQKQCEERARKLVNEYKGYVAAGKMTYREAKIWLESNGNCYDKNNKLYDFVKL
jgi:hypothetical protein